MRQMFPRMVFRRRLFGEKRLITSNPGYYSWYPSAMCSPWYVWLCELGYPMLDVRKWDDGEWAILQYHTKPYIPSLTRFHWVLQGLKNIELTPAFLSKFVDMIDITKREVWDREEKKTKEVEREHLETQRHQEDMVNRAAACITGNEALMSRVAKFGLREIELAQIAKNIPYYRW